MVISKAQSEIIPNVTMSGPSRKGVRKLIAKKYSMRPSDRLSQLPTGFRHPSKEIVREFESLLPALNAFDVSKYERYEKVEFDYVGGIPISALRNPAQLKTKLRKARKGTPGGYYPCFSGSASEIGDLIDGTFKHAFEESSSMSNAVMKSKFHEVFGVEIAGCCDGIYRNRPIEVKSVSSLGSMNVLRTLAKNWFQFAAYNWLYGHSPIIAIVCRESLNIELVELESDMVEIAMRNWSKWNSQIAGSKPDAAIPVSTESILVK